MSLIDIPIPQSEMSKSPFLVTAFHKTEQNAVTVTVVIPTYNRADLLAEAIASVRQQTRPPEEIVVIDDGSTDGTEAMMAREASSVRYIRQKNAGPAAARNLGLQSAQSDFVALLDSDDLWAPDRLQRQIAMLQRHPELDVMFGLEAKFTATEKFERCEIRDKTVVQALDAADGPLADPFELLLKENYIPTSSILFRRECLVRTGLMDPAVEPAEDYDLWFKLALAGYKFGFINAVLCHRRIHGGNLVNQWTRLTASGAKVLARYYDRVPTQRPAAAQRLSSIYYDLGSQHLKQREFGRAFHYLRQSHPSGLKGLIRSIKLALAWICSAGRTTEPIK